MAPPKKSDKVRKLVPLKVPYKELRSFMREPNPVRGPKTTPVNPQFHHRRQPENQLQRREKLERRLAKRRKVVSDDEGDLALEVRRTETEVDVGGTVVEVADITLPSSPVEDVTPEEEKETSGVEVKMLEVTFPDFLQDSVVPLLKYLDGKREKYVVSKEAGFYVQLVRNRTKLKRAVAVKREWDSATELAPEQAANLLTKCAAVKATLQAEAYNEAVKRPERLITTAEKREQKHVEELARVEAQRAEEVRIAEELRGKIAEAKTAEEDLCGKIAEIAGKCDMEFRRAEELSTSLSAGNLKHDKEVTNWTKKLGDCESARSLEVECKLKVQLECRRLREQLGKADMRLQESQRRMEKAEEAYRQLWEESTDELKLRLEKCLNGFAI
ncbi:hypothetical protein AXG93_4003s1050 [Marchantia polymorpha subsp. ruderalis]|uniref:Uncharacterized protein n=1 Tax=Marchantia polymorpha subsp. ruderalis TaxID=1480154 RepID=A0A176W992_MARPO|nr:hypothetical protein AXG93_4003s1050 [Marchantia polymorpha subsp. ruderalis]